MDIVQILIIWLVTAVSLFLISKVPPLGVDIDTFERSLISAAVFGLLNALLRPVLGVLALPITFVTFGLFTIVLNAIIFGLAAYLVEGFRLRHGIWSAILGAIALGFVNSVLFQVLAKVFPG